MGSIRYYNDNYPINHFIIGSIIMQSSRRSLERGQGLVEYALALVLVAVVVIVVLALTGVSLRKVFCGIVYQVRGTSTPGVSACPDPYVTVLGIDGTRNPRIEAVIQDDKGGTDSTNMN
jgi:pilus assembly protein Flp/PilA